MSKFQKGQRVMILEDKRVDFNGGYLEINKGLCGVVESVMGGMYTVRFNLSTIYSLVLNVPEIGLSEA